MKKKWLLTGSVAGISGAIMVTTGFTAFAGTSGYEEYKAALKNTALSAGSVTVQAAASLKDNGSTLSQAKSTLKLDRSTEAVSGTLQVTGSAGAQDFTLYNTAEGQVWKSADSGTYYLKQDKADHEEEQAEPDSGAEVQDDAWFSSQEESVIDALLGNLKNEITSSTASDGTKNISLQLDSAQIPAVVQALAPVAFKHLTDPGEQHDNKESATEAGLSDPEDLIRQSLLKADDITLTDAVQISSISMHAVVSPANELQQQQVDITFSGLDAAGASHTLTASLDVQLSAINGTTPDTIDLTGKQVVQVKEDHEDGHRD